MSCFLKTLYSHARRWRYMTPCDVVKLAYQSVYGPGHMITDPAKTRERLEKEYAALDHKSVFSFLTHKTGSEFIEPIGGGMVRLHLSELDPDVLPLAAVNDLFCCSARKTVGTQEEMQKRLADIRHACAAGYFSFDITELEKFLTAWQKEGMPPVSHSALYKEKYSPSYRVIRAEYVPYLAPIGAVYRKIARHGRTVIAIDGMSGSGKSTFSTLLSELTGGEIIHMDDFFLPAEKRTAERLSQPGGNVDYERFTEEVVSVLAENKNFTYGVFDCSAMAVTYRHTVKPAAVRIVEGSYAMHPYFGDYADVSVFLYLAPDVQMQRIVARNGERMAEKFKNIWIPMENRYFREKKIAEHCRYVIRTDL